MTDLSGLNCEKPFSLPGAVRRRQKNNLMIVAANLLVNTNIALRACLYYSCLLYISTQPLKPMWFISVDDT